jgi:hypothetical protein
MNIALYLSNLTDSLLDVVINLQIEIGVSTLCLTEMTGEKEREKTLRIDFEIIFLTLSIL